MHEKLYLHLIFLQTIYIIIIIAFTKYFLTPERTNEVRKSAEKRGEGA